MPPGVAGSGKRNMEEITLADVKTANPLLTRETPIPFDSIKADMVEPAIHTLVDQSREALSRIASGETPRTYTDILMGLDGATEPLDFAISTVRHLEAVATTPELRAAYNSVQGPVSAFYSSIPLNSELWSAVKAIAESSEAKELRTPHRRYLQKTVTGFRRAGADLSPEDKRELEKIDVELTRITTKFAENILDATNAFELLVTDESRVSGLPESALAAARESAKAKNLSGWRFTLQAPSYIAAMTYLDDRQLRAELWDASNRRGMEEPYDNRHLITQILALRRKKARLLGYKDFSDLVLEERMAHNGQHAQRFLEELGDKTLPFFERENRELAEVAETFGIDPIEPWDLAYLAEKQRLKLYDFDEEELRPYFELDRVVAGMFDIFGRVLGIRVVEERDIPGWDPAVKYYRVEDTNSGLLLGGFYSDWFPRENKRGGAWMDSLIVGDPDAGKPHLGLICGNLTPPVEGRPSLLTHREVETVFHEFGHLLHHTLSRVPVRSLAGTNVPWDFVELPSQIMENWCMEREALDLFARHYQTGERIPDELFQKMRRARTFRSANLQMRQLGLGLVDLRLHREFDPEEGADVMEFARSVLQSYTPVTLPPFYGLIASFTHLFASPVAYGAGYYSYKWAEVLDADAFTRFHREGIFNAATGSEYRRQILERGDSEDPAVLYRNFVGRDPDANALLERLGLVAA